MPDPSPLDRPVSICNLTTLGITLAATCSTEPGGRFAAGRQDGPSATAVCATGEGSDWTRYHSGADPPAHHGDGDGSADHLDSAMGPLLLG